MEHESRASSYSVRGHTCGLHERFLTKALEAGSSTCLESSKHMFVSKRTLHSMLSRLVSGKPGEDVLNALRFACLGHHVSWSEFVSAHSFAC